MRKASEAHRPTAWISEGGTPCSASAVAPPAHMDWPLTVLSKKEFKRLMKKDLVGTNPSSVYHRANATGCKWLRESR